MSLLVLGWRQDELTRCFRCRGSSRSTCERVAGAQHSSCSREPPGNEGSLGATPRRVPALMASICRSRRTLSCPPLGNGERRMLDSRWEGRREERYNVGCSGTPLRRDEPTRVTITFCEHGILGGGINRKGRDSTLRLRSGRSPSRRQLIRRALCRFALSTTRTQRNSSGAHTDYLSSTPSRPQGSAMR